MVPFGRTAAIFDVDDSLLDGNAGTIFTWYLYSEKVMRPEMRARVPRIVYDYARKRLTEQDMVEVGSRCQQGLRADELKAHAHACFEKHLRKRITMGAVRQIRKRWHSCDWRRADRRTLRASTKERLMSALIVDKGWLSGTAGSFIQLNAITGLRVAPSGSASAGFDVDALVQGNWVTVASFPEEKTATERAVAVLKELKNLFRYGS